MTQDLGAESEKENHQLDVVIERSANPEMERT